LQATNGSYEGTNQDMTKEETLLNNTTVTYVTHTHTHTHTHTILSSPIWAFLFCLDVGSTHQSATRGDVL